MSDLTARIERAKAAIAEEAARLADYHGAGAQRQVRLCDADLATIERHGDREHRRWRDDATVVLCSYDYMPYPCPDLLARLDVWAPEADQ